MTPPTSNSDGLITYISSNTNVATVSGNGITITGAGTVIITVMQASSANYIAGMTRQTLTILKSNPFLDNFSIPMKQVGILPFVIPPPATRSDGLITYTSLNANVATISGNIATITGTGTSLITAVQYESANYLQGTITTTLTSVLILPSYVEFGSPVSIAYSRTVPITPAFMMKSLFTDNSRVVYKPGSLAAGGVGSVANSRRKSRYV
jgi:hypothetical protein